MATNPKQRHLTLMSQGQVLVWGPDALDYGSFVELQRKVFGGIVAKAGAEHLSERFYRWKYHTPFGKAHIAVVFEGDQLVAANAMYPLQVVSRGQCFTAWQSCETAALPEVRGKGYFRKCIEALSMRLGQNEIFFGFPNETSAPGLASFGWNEHGLLNSWLRIIPTRASISSTKVVPITHFDATHDSFFQELSRAGGPMLERSARYLTWRYLDHPVYRYFSYGSFRQGKLTGVLILRRAHLYGVPITVAMELLALDEKTECELARAAAAWSRSGSLCTLISNNTFTAKNAFRTAFVPIPIFAQPKRQVLMGRAQGPEASSVWKESWRIQIGDWDVL